MLDKDDELRLNAILSKEYWSTDETQIYLTKIKGIQTTTASLRTMITRSGGPKFYKWGRSVRYTKSHIDEWVAERISEPKTHSLG